LVKRERVSFTMFALLASAEGRIWEAPGPVIFELARAENEGRFDEVPPELGDRVLLSASQRAACRLAPKRC
jgi:hypothetical protein